MASPLDSSQFVRLLDKRLREVAEGKYNDIPSRINDFYKVMSSDSAWEEFYEVNSVPDIPEFVGKLTELGVTPGYHTKVAHKEYAAFVQTERKFIDDKKYSVLDNRAMSLMEAAARTREKQAVQPFTNSFSASHPFMTTEHGEALCANSHGNKSGASTTPTDNLGTTALGKAALATARLAMKKFTNGIGEHIDVGDDLMVLVPIALRDTADEIVGTPKGLYTTEHTINVAAGRYEVMDWMRLDDSDTNDWWLIWKSQMKKDLLWLNRIMPETKMTVDWDTYMVNYLNI
ncbi:MAG: phage major capsid protein [Planctomycetota bacterium]|jgi:hypothetical protein